MAVFEIFNSAVFEIFNIRGVWNFSAVLEIFMS